MVKSGFVAIMGRPNVGKSTLLNVFINEKLAIVTSKPQTTRNNIRGIYNDQHYQIIFVDTPGVHKPRTSLGEFMVNSAMGAMEEVDLAILVVDALKGISEVEGRICAQMRDKAIPAVAVINKIDALPREKLLPIISELKDLTEFDSIIPISAIQNDGTDMVFSQVKKYMKEGPRYYPEDELTDLSERDVAAEIIREKLLKLLDDEVPHGTAVEVLSMKELPDIINMDAVIYCEKTTHKSIIIGKKGAMIKKIATYSREEMEKFFNKKIFLQVWVKVRDDWRNSKAMLNNLGYR